MNKARLNGFLIDVRCPSEENLEVDVDASNVPWTEYKSLIEELEDLLSSIDEAHSARSWLTKGRGLKARYKRVSATDRQRRISFCPFPSKFQNLLKNTRTYIYELVAEHSVVLESVGNRKVYLLPKELAPFFIEAVEKLNENVIEPLKENIEKFRQSDEYLAIQQCLHRHGVDPSILKAAVFPIRGYIVDVLPVDFGYSVNADDVYAKMERANAVRGLEILRNQIERKFREYALNAVSDVIARIMAIAEGLETKGRRVRNPSKKVDQLIKLCESLGLEQVCEKVLRPLKSICFARPYQRPKLAEQYFGNKSLKAGVGEALKNLS